MQRRALIAALALAPSLTARTAHAKKAEGEEKKKGGGLQFIQIQTMTASIVRRTGRKGVMTVETGVDVPDKALHARAEASLPRLRAAFAQLLNSYAVTLAPGTIPNADYLSRELQRQTDLVLGKPGAKLLLGTILIN